MAYLVIRELGQERIQPIGSPEVTIGRSRQNTIRLLAEQASRRHCKLVRTDRGYRAVDLNSSNGLYINGLKVTEKDLADGDMLRLGHAWIVYREGEPPLPGERGPESLTAPIPLQDRNVQILLQTVVGAASAQDLQTFLTSAVDNVIEITQAERGILFTRGGSGELIPQVARDREGRTIEKPSGISRTIPQQVWDTRRAIYLLDTENRHETVQSRSVSIYHLRTVMCAPLRVGERLLGVLYVDSRAKSREYTATDMALFEAVANTLALTMENLRAGQEAKRREEEKRRALERENELLRAALEKRRHLIGACPAMKALYETVRKVAPTDATVLIQGESGTGKEAIAHVLHDLSPRSSGPFVVIEGSAIPETLLESELFGYEKGAFTGAAARKPGKFELAHGGTLFLDEIGELPPSLQAKLLRALEERTVMRVGGTDPLPVDVRLVAATHRNLEEMVRQGRFRQDLYFRLKVVTITVPPLRERGDDILLLAEFFLAEANATHHRSVRGFTPEAREILLRHRWNGNVRELKHRVEQAVILTENELLTPEDLDLTREGGQIRPLEEARDAFEKLYIVKALGHHESNVTRTARALGISRQHLQNLIRKHRIPRGEDEEGPAEGPSDPLRPSPGGPPPSG